MTTFWVLAAGLTGLALLFILPPLFRKQPGRDSESPDENQVNLAVFKQQLEELDADLAAGNLDQDQYASARRDLEKELLLDVDDGAPVAETEKSGRWAAAALALTVPAMALGMYAYVGDQAAIDRGHGSMAAAQQERAPEDMPPMEELVARLAERMEQEPDNVDGWVMLGRSYLTIGEPEKAVASYQRADQLRSDDPDILLGYAEALARVNGSLQGQPAELIEKARELDPANANGLWMSGLVSFQSKNFVGALESWRRLETMIDPESEDAESLRGFIAEARSRAGMNSAESPPVAPEPVSAPETAAQQQPPVPTEGARADAIQVAVTLSDALADKVSPNDVLFVFARAVSGPPMPLAVKRLRVRDLPLTVTLDDSMAMMPAMKLSGFQQVLVGARISKTGNAMPESGDPYGEISPVVPGQAGVIALSIDRVRP